jgi:hypothetical protein
MPRILYLLFTDGTSAQGGHKMIIRHVETLRELGFNAYLYLGRGSVMPPWLEHRAPVEHATPVLDDDIVVMPDDAQTTMGQAGRRGLRAVVLSQNPYYLGATAFEALASYPKETFPTLLAVSPRLAALLQRLFPQARVRLTPAFADERLFRPGAEKAAAIAYAPKKRTIEAAATQSFFRHLHPRHAHLEWTELKGLTEKQTAAAFARSALCLSLSRLESLGITTLEAMACGCICAGFRGIGGEQYATEENGFWVQDDDCEAAADALAQAADLVAAGGAALARMQEAGFETARRWSHAAFRETLEAAWMEIAPDLRLKAGPLDEGRAA